MADEFDKLNALMARVKTEPNPSTGKILVVYSAPKCGKTTTFCCAPNSVLVQAKDYSAEPLKESGGIKADMPVVDANSWDDMIDILETLASSKYKNVILDGGSGASEFCDNETLAKEMEGDRDKFTSWGKGDKLGSIRWQELVEKLNDLKAAGIWVFILCHKATLTERNAGGNDYLKNRPAMSKEQFSQLSRYSDAILFIDFLVANTSVNKQSGVAKVVGGEQRIMYTTPSASYEAGNRLGLTEPIELGGSPQEGFKNFFNAVKAARKK